MIDITFKKTVDAKGHAGTIEQTGIVVMGDEVINFSPNHKGGWSGDCFLEIPKENLPELLPIFGTDDLLNELKKRNADPAKFTEKQTLIASLLDGLYNSCQEEIDKNRDKGAAFEEIQNITSQIKCLIGLQR